MSYKVDAWHLVIAYGGFYEDTPSDEYYSQNPRFVELYSSTPNLSRDASAIIYEDILKYGIDYDASSDSKDRDFQVFEDTDADFGRLTCLLGTLVLKNGDSYSAGVAIPPSTGFGTTIKLLTETLTLDEALASLAKRLSKDESEFPFSCHLPGV